MQDKNVFIIMAKSDDREIPIKEVPKECRTCRFAYVVEKFKPDKYGEMCRKCPRNLMFRDRWEILPEIMEKALKEAAAEAEKEEE